MTAGDRESVILGLAKLFLNGEQDANRAGKEGGASMNPMPNITAVADSLNLLSPEVQMLRRYVKEVRVEREQARLEEEVRLTASAKAAVNFSFIYGDRDPAAILQRLPASIRAFNTQIAAATATTVYKTTAPDDPTAYEHPCLGDLGRVMRVLHFPDPDRPCRQLLSTGKALKEMTVRTLMPTLRPSS